MGDTTLDNTIAYQEFLEDRHPLLDDFRRKAGATLKHCQNVAHLCDVVAANTDQINRARLKIAATYHDVGKTLNPEYFTENQDGINPHDDLDPQVSFQIISRHVSDGAALLVQHRFPLEIIDIVLQHHGNSIMKYFYRTASQDEEVDVEGYRYPWPTPQTPEAAILMIADVVEAAARSKHDHGRLPPDIEGRTEFVEQLIKDLENDGQLDNVPLGIVRVARELIPEELGSMFHTRVDYDEVPEEDSRGRAKKNKKARRTLDDDALDT